MDYKDWLLVYQTAVITSLIIICGLRIKIAGGLREEINHLRESKEQINKEKWEFYDQRNEARDKANELEQKLTERDALILRMCGVQETYFAGDVVRLKSGGPLMTVEGFENGKNIPCYCDFARCTWFDNNSQRSELISCAALDRITPAPVNPDKEA